jgi:nucleotidyltransferase/DNA polymerase involved in DNA repair
MMRPVAATGIEPLDDVLRGGLPIGAISEMVGPECSGRSSVALSFLAQVTQAGKVCCWIDVANTFEPESAAAIGVDLTRLLWVRCGVAQTRVQRDARNFILPEKYLMMRVEVDTFTQSVVLSRSLQSEAATRDILLECAGAFSPRIEDRSEDAALLFGIDIAGTQSLFGPPEMVARDLLERVSSLGISVQITVSRNFHAAVCLAKGMSQRTPLQAITPGEEATVLAPLPLSVLDLTETQAETFGLWGIHTLGMLAALPEKELIARMGQDGKCLRQLARGALPHLFQPVEQDFALEERMDLDTPVELLESLLFVVGVMLDQLILRAKARILALASVTITLSLEGGASHSRTVRLHCQLLTSSSGSSCCTLISKRIRHKHLSLLSHFTLNRAVPVRCNPVSSRHSFRKRPVWMSRLLASAPSWVRGMSAALYSKIPTRRRAFAWNPSPCLRAALPCPFRRNSEPLFGSFDRRRQQPSDCKAHDRHSSSFAKNATRSSTLMVRGSPKATGGIRRCGDGSKGIWLRGRRTVPCCLAA